MKLVSLLVLIAIALCACQPAANATPTDRQWAAWESCFLSVELTKGIPQSEAPEFQADKFTDVADKEVRIEMTYEERGITYICELTEKAGDVWTVHNLEEK